MILQPNYYDSFKCIADKCKDNCCIGWEIDIDNETFNKYMSIGGDLGQRFKDEIATENGVHYFKLKEHDRCPFLNSNNLCDIICELGEGGLCQICNDHPRYINSYGDITERGLGLACEEACRIILTQNTGVYLIDSKNKAKFIPNLPDNPYLEYLYGIREIIVNVLQNRDYKITERLACAIELCEYIQNECASEKSDSELLTSLNDVENYVVKIFESIEDKLHCSSVSNKSSVIKEIFADYSELEILDEKWKELLNDTIKNIDSCVDIKSSHNSSSNYLYENMLVYLVYRYFLECYYDDMIIEKALFIFTTYTVVSNIALYLTYKNNTADIIDIVHRYSKEIEYSDSNIEALYNKYYNNSAYTKENVYIALG